jgi:phage shock protein PspC (stress-responsive transcriptional regulator)
MCPRRRSCMLIGMSGETETPAAKAGNGFEETVKDFWASRPRRPQHNRKVAGVAAAIGNRYGIDPVVIRVALVAATIFGGAGLVIYLLGWLLFPDERDQVSAFEGMIGKGRSSVSTGMTVVLCVALIPVASWVFGGGWFADGWFDGGGFIGMALIAGALFALHRGRGQFNRPVVQAPQSPAYGPAAFDAAFSVTDTDAGTAATDPAAPPAWDPLGAEPFAWDLPDPQPAFTPPPPVTPRPARPVVPRNKTVGLATFGLAVLVAGVGVVLNMDGNSWFSVQHIIGMVLGVLGIGLVTGSFVHGSRGLIGLAIPLAIAGLALTAIPVLDVPGGYGNIDVTPANAAEVQPLYQHSAGNIDVDFTRLGDSAQITSTLRSGAGDITAIVPENADVTYSCETTAGDTDCLGHRSSGFANEAITGVDLGPDGAGGAKINLILKDAAGNVEVRRG